MTYTLTDVHQMFASAFPLPEIRPYAWLLSKRLDEGHICIGLNEPGSMLAELPYTSVVSPDRLVQYPQLVGRPGEYRPFVIDGDRLYLQRYHHYETRIIERIREMTAQGRAKEPERWALLESQAGLIRTLGAGYPLSGLPPDACVDWQLIAALNALLGDFSIITGGPGTGKTTTLAKLLRILYACQPEARVALAAPTGKAAMRMLESLTASARDFPDDVRRRIEALQPATLHRLLGWQRGSVTFRHTAERPLDYDFVVVDEASMIDLPQFAKLLDACGQQARLVLLGDKDQLASVEAGAVLGDLCRDAAAGRYSAGTAQFVQTVAGQTLPAEYLSGGAAPLLAQQTVMLRQSRRFKGAIGQLALAVNRGDAAAARATLLPSVGASPRPRMPAEAASPNEASALLTLQPSNPQAVCALALGVSEKPSYAHYLRLMQQGPAGHGAETHAAWVRSVLKAFERFRILCAVHQGDWGTQELNAAVQKALSDDGLLKVTGEWFAGRPVMVTRNDAQLGVFNGDVGVVLPNTEGKLKVWFLDGEALRSVSVMRLPHDETAFVMTVHKSQGSEFEHTVLVLPPGGAEVLSRELVYTGITRAREQFTLIEAEAGLLEGAIHRPSVRASGLAQWWVLV